MKDHEIKKEQEKSNEDLKEADLGGYWQDVHRKNPTSAELKGEFSDGELDGFFKENSRSSRRDFFKVMGFSFATVPLATGCLRVPIKKALPFLKGSENVTPGIANWYATFNPHFNGGSILVKAREGRAIKIEGNPLSPSTLGGTSALTQASILGLYDANRCEGDQILGKSVSHDLFDAELVKKLNESIQSKKTNYLVTDKIHSPSTYSLISEFTKKFNVVHIIYSPYFLSSEYEVYKSVFQSDIDIRYAIEETELIVAFNRDFLGSDNQSVELTKKYSKAKSGRLEKGNFKHIQLESLLSLSGSNADLRYTISDDDELEILNLLVQELVGEKIDSPSSINKDKNQKIAKSLSQSLKNKKRKSILLSGSQDKTVQTLIFRLNQWLDNFGHTIYVYDFKEQRVFDDKIYHAFVNKISEESAGTIIFWDCNPLYSDFRKEKLLKGIKNSNYSVAISNTPNETTDACTAVASELHYLESYNEYFEAPGTLYFSQAVMNPVFDGRQGQEILLNLMGKKDWYNSWKSKVVQDYPALSLKWDSALHDGIFKVNQKSTLIPKKTIDIKSMKLSFQKKAILKTYQKYSIADGRFTNNPWLLEMPDPITKMTWENYLVVSPQYARKNNIVSGDIVDLKVKNKTLTLAALVQPGTEENTFAVAVGFGRTKTGKAGLGRGVNSYDIHHYAEEETKFFTSDFSIQKTGNSKTLPQTQTHHSMEGRDIVRETGLNEYRINPQSGNSGGIKLISLWGGHEKKGQQWGLVIDLDKCTGCSGCVISCNAENNVPVVGPEEVANRREMHWIRLDRYYKGDESNPEVVHQPVMCQHCDNAPCETVCPVLATVQSSDGLNQQVYNRCVGTRYCANNCPYKVRRFNWFDYPHDDKYENMVLNPDITVRSRGVMEKCSMCVQRIQEKRLQAKMEGRDLKDGEIKMACEQSCPADAIVFGDINDKNSRIFKLLNSKRNYTLLQELNMMPRVQYLTKIKNKG